MQQKFILKLLPSEAADEAIIKKYIASSAGKKIASVNGFHLLKRSVDARGKSVFINLTVNAFIDEPARPSSPGKFHFKDVHKAAKKVIIIGAGPAGLFAALLLIEKGIKPVILERGKDVRARRRDLAKLNKEGIVNPESNYCFGEGGAGTYSDGKLYTRSNKRGDIDRILRLFIHFGAPESIAADAHPHIGTNKLPHIITAMHEQINTCGGEVRFEKKVTDLIIKDEKLIAVKTADRESFSGDAFILATGHSARDIFQLFADKKKSLSSRNPSPWAFALSIPKALLTAYSTIAVQKGIFSYRPRLTL